MKIQIMMECYDSNNSLISTHALDAPTTALKIKTWEKDEELKEPVSYFLMREMQINNQHVDLHNALATEANRVAGCFVKANKRLSSNLPNGIPVELLNRFLQEKPIIGRKHTSFDALCRALNHASVVERNGDKFLRLEYKKNKAIEYLLNN